MGLQRSKDSCQIFSKILQTVFSLQHGPCKRPVCVKLPEHAPCRFWLQSMFFLIDFGSSVTQARVSNTVRARDPCALIFSNTVRAYQVTVRAIAFTYTLYAYMNMFIYWMNSSFKTINSALGVFMKVVDNFLSFPEHFESSQLDICSSRYFQNTERCSDTN